MVLHESGCDPIQLAGDCSIGTAPVIQTRTRAWRRVSSGYPTAAAYLMALMLAAAAASPATAQTTGQILGRAIDADTRTPVVSAEITIVGREIRALTSERGDFILTAVPTGEHQLRVERIGYRPTVVTVRVRAGRTTQVTVILRTAPVEVEAVAAEVERVGLIEPDVVASQEVLLGRELRVLPLDNIEEAIELTTGVAAGHFRGGRVGQETYKLDGLEIKNQLEAATQGTGLELSPTSLEEMEVVTGGFAADNGSALSGVVSYTTRRGSAERWGGQLFVSSDSWAPDDLFMGFSGISASAGGPIPFIGEGSTIFADILAQGRVDAEPRARGLTCLTSEDDPELAAAINSLKDNPATAHLYCPYTSPRLPYQRGDRFIGFVRLDRPLTASTSLMFSFLHNRRQRERYTPEFKYNPVFQLGQREKGYLGSLTLDWTRHNQGRAYHLTARVAAMWLDRYLGVLDPWSFGERNRIGGFGLSDIRFLGEDFVRSPIDEQLESGSPVPGYEEPSGVTGSPFGPAAEGIFVTEGTPEIANWSRSSWLGADLLGEILSTRGHAFRVGALTRFYRVENYERVRAHLPGSSPNFARFFPATLSGYAEASLLAVHDVTVRIGLRLEAFRSGLDFQTDRVDFLAPVIDTRWRANLLPRFGMAIPVPRAGGPTLIRLNYGVVAQVPDFTFFLDRTLGDSLQTDIRRQGNPNLTFERGAAWEVGVSQLVTSRIALNATLFYKELNSLVTSSLSFRGVPDNQFTTGDFGTVKGVELSVEARFPALRLRAGYALQSAKGVTSGALEDPGEGLTERRIEFPLAFDRRHSIDLILLAGHSAGAPEQKWGFTLTGFIRSGFPLGRFFEEVDVFEELEVKDRLPWTHVFNVRLSREFGALPGCGGCSWQLVAVARNVLGTDNIIALRRDTGTIAPATSDLFADALEVPGNMDPIPFESPNYSALGDLNSDGLITAQEMQTARFAAALDRSDPSLFFGPARELRLGLEVAF